VRDYVANTLGYVRRTKANYLAQMIVPLYLLKGERRTERIVEGGGFDTLTNSSTTINQGIFNPCAYLTGQEICFLRVGRVLEARN